MLTIGAAGSPIAVQAGGISPLALAPGGSPLSVSAVAAAPGVAGVGAPAVSLSAVAPQQVFKATATPVQLTATASSVLLGPVGQGSGFEGFNVPFTGVAAGRTVPLPAKSGSFSILFVQGVFEDPANYSVSGATLTIPAGLVWDGADCLFVFAALTPLSA
jgi:hypothetical protein